MNYYRINDLKFKDQIKVTNDALTLELLHSGESLITIGT